METDAMPTHKRGRTDSDRIDLVLSGDAADGLGLGSQRASLLAEELVRLNTDLVRVTAERDQLAEQQRQIAELLQTKDPAKLIHSLRNVLNELNLLRILARDRD
jgi:hypothetical protein